MQIKETDKLQYPVVTNKSGQKKDFIAKMFDVMSYQTANPNETPKSSFLEQDAQGNKIHELKLSNQLFKSCNFYNATIVASIFTDCTFIECNFTAASLFNVKFNSCVFRDCNFTDAEMQDVNAETSQKTNCILKNIDLSKNVRGFSIDDSKIIQDNIEDKANKTENKSVYDNVKTALSDWEEIEEQCFELTSKDDSNCGLAVYPNKQKNSQENEDIWEFVFFYGNESLLMNDYNLFGLTSDNIKTQIEQWKDDVLINQSNIIIKNLLTILED